MYTITVSNLKDSGTGSLRQAILDANAYTGSEDIIIVFDDALAGQTLTLPSGLPELSKACTFDAKEVTLQGRGTIFVRDGGKILLVNANIFLHGGGELVVETGGTMDMQGGNIQMWGDLSFDAGASADLKDVKIECRTLYNAGKLSLTGTTHDASIINSGVLNMLNVTTDYNDVSSTGTLTAKGVILGSYLEALGASTLENVTCTTLYVDSVGDVVTNGTGVILTSDEVIGLRDFSGNVEELLESFTWTATSEGEKYIGLTGTFGDTELTVLPESFTGGYKMLGSVTVNAGTTMTLGDGVCISRTGDNQCLNIDGTLEVKNSVVSDALLDAYDWNDVRVRNGGKLLLENANVDISGYSYLEVYSGGTMEMVGGSLQVFDGLQIYEGGRATLSNVTVVETTISVSGTMTAEKTTFEDYVDNTIGTGNYTECTFMDGLGFSSVDQVTLRNCRFEGEEVFHLMDFSGDTAQFLSLADSTTFSENACITIESLNTCTLSDISSQFHGGYQLDSGATINAGHTVTLGDGVTLRLSQRGSNWEGGLRVYGTLIAHNTRVADMIVAPWEDSSGISVREGGKILLENANVKLSESDTHFWVDDGGVVEMRHGSLKVYNGLHIDAEGTANLEGVDVQTYIYNRGTLNLSGTSHDNYITNSGELTMSSCDMQNQDVTLNSNSEASITNTSGIGKLTINSGCHVTIKGNDFSGSTIVLNDVLVGEVIDLSGNYWGTTDFEEIIGKIQGYDESRVIINSIMSEPNARVFSFDSSMFGAHRVSNQTESLELTFNAYVDSSTVSEQTIRLIDAAGQVLQVSGYVVSGNRVTLMLDGLPQGSYNVQVESGLCDVYGNAFTEPEGQRKVNFLSMELSVPKVIFFRTSSTVTDQFRYVDIFFDQDMDASTITTDNVHIYTESGQEISINLILQSGEQGNTFFRAYFDRVTEQGTYQIVVDAAVQTIDGRHMDAAYMKAVYVSSPDLEISDMVECSDNRLGRYTNITYTVHNTGDGVAQGSWTDSIYLCKSATWDESQAVFFASVQRNEQTIAPGESYTATARALLGWLEPGEYYIFVKTDMSSRLRESQESNNLSATGTSICLTPPAHELGTQIHELSSANEVFYVAYTATENASIRFTVEDVDARIYVSEELPTASNSTAKVVDSAGESCAYFMVEAGKTYYIGVEARKSGELRTLLEKVEIGVFGSSLSYVSPGCESSLIITGIAFTEGMKVWLEDDAGNKYDATSVGIIDVCKAKVTIVLPHSLEHGTSLTLCAESPSGSIATMEQKLKVDSYSDSLELKFYNGMNEWSGAAYSRVGYVWKTDLSVKNIAVHDLDNAIVLLNHSDDDFAMYYGYDDAKVRDRSALLFMVGNADDSPFTLEAGESGKVKVYIKAHRDDEGEIQAWVLQPGDATEITKERWNEFASALRPTACNDATWAAWWGDMQPRIGSTVGDFVSFIQEMQQISVQNGFKQTDNLSALTAYMMENHPDYAPSPLVYGCVLDSQSGEVQKNVEVSLYAKNGDSWIYVGSAITDENGNYRIKVNNPGEHVLVLSASELDMDGDGMSEAAMSTFLVSSEDVEINPHVLTSDYNVERVGDYSLYAASTKGLTGRLTNYGGQLWFATGANGSWGRSYQISANQISNYMIAWDEAIDSFVLFWEEPAEDGQSSIMVQTIHLDENQNIEVNAPVLLSSVSDAAEYVSLVQVRDGHYTLLVSENGNMSYADFNIADEMFLERLIIDEPDAETAAVTEEQMLYVIKEFKIPLIDLGVEVKWGAGVNYDVNKPCEIEVRWDIEGSATIATAKNGPYVMNKLDFTMDYDGSSVYYINDSGEKKEREINNTYGMHLEADAPQALIYVLKTWVPIVGQPLWVCKNKLSKLGIEVQAGIKGGFDLEFSDGSADLGLNITIYGGIESKKDDNCYVRASGSLGGSIGVNLDTFSIIPNSGEYEVSLTLSVSIPLFWDVYYTGEFKFSCPDKSEPVETTRLKMDNLVPKVCLFDSATVSGNIHTVKVDESGGKSVVKISTREGNEVCLSDVGQNLGELASGKGYITDLLCYADGDSLIIIVDGYSGNVDKLDFPADATLDELIAIKERLELFRRHETIRVSEEAISSFSEEKEAGCIYQSDVYKAQDGTVYRAAVFAQSGGGSYLSIRQMQNDGWNLGSVAYKTANIIYSVSIVEENGRITVHLTERSTNGRYYSKTIEWKDGVWQESSSTNTLQTDGLKELISYYANLGDPWEKMVECALRKEEKPDAKLEDKTYNSYDPNDIYGPVGYGSAGWIAPQEMQFQIVCENKPEENIAHAAQVIITQQIDAAYDYSTFRLGDMTIAGNYITVEGDVQRYNARLDWTDTLGVWVDVNAWFDADTGIVTWEFAAIDPETGYFVADPFTGLLAPNYNPPEGDGGVYYYVTPKSTVTTGTEIKAQASIVFDYNEPIETPTLTYTFDVDAPEAVVKSMAAESSSRYLYVAWEGSDVGSGVDYYNIFVSIDGGDWQLWQNGIAATSALYTVAEGEHTYAFFAQGVDHAGNAEALSEMMAAEAATVSTYDPSAGTLTVSAFAANRTGDELVLRVVFSEAASCSDWAAALRLTAASGAIDLSNGSFSYDAATHTLTWTGSVAGVVDGEKATLRLADGMVKDAQGVAMGDTTPSYSAPVVLDAVAGATYAAPTLVDYNGDGLLDMLVGENANGKGQVRIYLNEGTAEVADYASFIYAQTAADTPLTLDAEGCQGAIVRLTDVTGDGVAEMLIGLADGTVRVFTAAEGGYWSDAGLLTCMMGGKSATIDVGIRAAIDFVDANGDGRVDMLVGTGDGNIVLYLDTAATGAAVFDGGQYLHDTAGRITLGNRASVSATDVDGDGLWDLLVGDANGSIRYYRNEGSATEPLFGEAESILAGDVALDLSESTDRVRIDAADINGDGLLDIAVGQSDGSVKLLYGTDGANLLGEVVVGNIPLPDAPQQVQISVEASKVTLSWDAVVEEGGAITYEVSYCMQGSTTPMVVSVSDITTTLELPDGIYSVQVRALNYGMGGTWSAAQTVTVDTVAPETPAAATAVGGETSASISWSAVADAASYELRYRSAGSSTWRIVTATETSQTLTDMAAAGYEWQVRAVDAAGNASEWTSVSEFTVTGELPDYEKHWATGLVFDAQGSVTGGYYDVNKLGVNDSQLCWAAAATNVLTWWQEQGDTALSVSGVPTDAASIYATFCGAWENASGVDAYGFIWWLAGESTGSNYADYYDSHYTGDSSTGAYYEQYYTPQNVAQYAALVSLKNTAADTLSTSWDSIYAGGGMITLGIFRSLSSNGTLSDGHSLTLWGYETEVESGMLTSIYVTDSDDGTTALITLGVEYDNASGLYRVAADAERIGGYYLGTYNYLKGFTHEDIVAPEVAMGSLTQTREENGTTSVNFEWQGNADAERYELVVDGELRYSGTDTSFVLAQLGDGEHSYTIRAIDAAGNIGEYSGTLRTDAKQDDAAYQAADIALGTLPGGGCGTGEAIRNWVGDIDEQDYFRISSEGVGSYSIGIDSADVDAALWLSVGTMNAAGQFVVEQELLINPDCAVHGLAGVNLGAGETRYIRVSVADGTQGTDYALTVKGHVADSSMLTDNNSLSKATQLSETTEESTLNSWVGAGDALDYYRLEMTAGGSLSICLSELEQHAKVRLYQQHADGTVTQAFSTTAQAQSALDRTLSLTSGVYYLEIAAYDNGAGQYNSTYALELEKEENGTTKRFTIANA